MPTLGVIGGSGLYELAELVASERISVDTPYGRPSDEIVRGRAVEVPRGELGARVGVHRRTEDGGDTRAGDVERCGRAPIPNDFLTSYRRPDNETSGRALKGRCIRLAFPQTNGHEGRCADRFLRESS